MAFIGPSRGRAPSASKVLAGWDLAIAGYFLAQQNMPDGPCSRLRSNLVSAQSMRKFSKHY
jgi:hypothetical protein